MMNAQIHRGPDDAGEYHDEDVRLGFRRLSVIDLETGQQPFRYEDDRAVLVMNGEIYNFRELRAELEPRNTFRSKGDAEVVLRKNSEENKGEELLLKLTVPKGQSRLRFDYEIMY